MLKVSLFGDFRAAWDGVVVDRLPRRLAGDLWVFLLLHREVPLPVGQLAAVFWPDNPESEARGNLRRYLHFLSQTLPPIGEGPPWVLRDRNTVQWNPGAPIDLDVADFESAVRRARIRADDDEISPALEDLREASRLYVADLLPGVEAAWLDPPRERLRSQHLNGLDLLARLESIEGRYAIALGIAEGLIDLAPERESSQSLIVWLLAATGRRQAALDRFEAYRAMLTDRSGMAPGREIAALRAAVESDAMLDAWHPGAVVKPELAKPATALALAKRQSAPGNLPESADIFVGRSQAIEAIAGVFAIARLVTLTGVGGAGKSRLAIELARGFGRQFIDGVWWADLAALPDPQLMDRELAAMLRLKPVPGRALIEVVAEHIGDRSLLIILDNCEHLVEASAAVAVRLLSAGPGVRVLATSRVKLGIPGEAVWPVPALDVPVDDATLSAADIEGYESIQLFEARVRGLWPEFMANPARLQAMARICRQVEGIPLAIELAAARVSVLDIEEIAERLESSFAVLRRSDREHPERHQTLTTAIDWGYQLLSVAEQALLRRLSVFAGGFTPQSAEAICSGTAEQFVDVLDGADVYDLVGRLVEKSFVTPELRTGRGRRYRLLEMIREYGRERLARAGEADLIARRHSHYFVEMVEHVEPHLKQVGAEAWLDRLELEQYNLRAAMQWMRAQADWSQSHRFCAAAWRYWHLRGHIDHEREWTDGVLAQSGVDLPLPVDANAYYGAGVLAYVQGDLTTAHSHWMTSVDLWRRVGDQKLVAVLTNNLGQLAIVKGDFDAANTFAEEALEISQSIGDRAAIAGTMSVLAEIAKRRGDYGLAYQRFRDSLSILRDIEGADNDRADVLRGLGGYRHNIGHPVSRSDRLTG